MTRKSVPQTFPAGLDDILAAAPAPGTTAKYI
jgi:hypothetical protein